MTQVLTAAEIKAANLKAIKDGTLGAQQYVASNGRYQYPNGCRCAIGVALNDETLEKVLEAENKNKGYFTVTNLIEQNLIALSNPEELDWIARLQYLHDDWVGREESNRKYCEERFRNWLESAPFLVKWL